MSDNATLDPTWVRAEIMREERSTEERIKYIRDLAMQCLAQQEEHAAARIAELEAANAVCRRDIEALMTSCDKLEAKCAKWEASLNMQMEDRIKVETERDRLMEALTEIDGHMTHNDHALAWAAARAASSPTTSGE